MPRASEFDAVASRIGLGSTEEDDKALARLQSLAQDVAEAEGWNRYALGLYAAHRHLQAADVLRQILATGESDAYRLNLAAAYSQVAFIDLCRRELRTVAEKGANEELRRLAGQQLSRYEEFVGLDVDMQRLRGLQLAALERQVEASDAALDQLLRLAGLLLAQARAVGDESMTERGRVVLEKAAARFPLSEEVVQYLVQIHIGSDDDAPLSRLLETVRRRDPRSPLLRFIESYSEAPVASIFTVRADALARVGQESPDLSEAASSDLARLVATHPGNSWIRLQHAWLLVVRGNEALAAEHARRLRNVSGRSHAFHFNLGQLLG